MRIEHQRVFCGAFLNILKSHFTITLVGGSGLRSKNKRDLDDSVGLGPQNLKIYVDKWVFNVKRK